MLEGDPGRDEPVVFRVQLLSLEVDRHARPFRQCFDVVQGERRLPRRALEADVAGQGIDDEAQPEELVEGRRPWLDRETGG